LWQWSSGLVPPLLLAPRFFRGEIEYGMIAQGGRAFRECFDSFSVVVQNMASLASLAASVARLAQLDEALEAIAEERRRAERSSERVSFVEDPERIAVSDLNLRLARRLMLPAGLSFAWGGPGERGLLVCGPSGVGKTSLLRCLARLFWQGSGSVRGPVSNVLFLTQRPFLSPLLPTLRALLCYALGPGEAPNTAALTAALEAVNLGKHAALLDEEAEWSARLSPGEAQRLSVARALLWAGAAARGRGTFWLLLDEATSALDEANEARLMELVAGLPRVRYVSVAHRAAMRRWHDAVLTLEAGSWTFVRNQQTT
jgi:putative ATP-binding cassette transporter